MESDSPSITNVYLFNATVIRILLIKIQNTLLTFTTLNIYLI